MYFYKFSQKSKENYLELAQRIIESDGVIAVAEKGLLGYYRAEGNCFEYKIGKKSLEKILDYFSNKSEPERKMVFVEAMIVAFIDGKFVSEEQKLLRQIQARLSISEVFFKKVQQWAVTSLVNWLKHVDQMNKEGEELLRD